MTNTSLNQIRQSYRLLVPQMDRMTRIFQDRLFAALPEARALFKMELNLHRQHFAAALALIVRNLPMLDALDEALRELGADHTRAGVRPEHYPPVREALLAAMAEIMGDGWSDELASDWRILIDDVASRLLAGSHG